MKSTLANGDLLPYRSDCVLPICELVRAALFVRVEDALEVLSCGGKGDYAYPEEHLVEPCQYVLGYVWGILLRHRFLHPSATLRIMLV